MNLHNFTTPESFAAQQSRGKTSPRGKMLIVSCRSAVYLAQKVAEQYQRWLQKEKSQAKVMTMHAVDQHFSDGETRVRLSHHVRGYDVFLFQALYDPTSESSVDQNYQAFLMATRALREYGANQVTAILPYLAYSRQDKSTRFQYEPTTAKLMADLSVAAGIDRLVSWHPHSRQTRGFYNGLPVEFPDVISFFTQEYCRFQSRKDVIIVAPDAGASEIATYLARKLNLKSAIAAKYRPKPEHATVSEIAGDFSNKHIAIVLDDMINTGGTFSAVVKKLVTEKGIQEVYGGISHNLCTPQAHKRLVELRANYNLKGFVVTNSIPQTQAYKDLSFFQVRGLDSLLAEIINHIHYSISNRDKFGDQEEERSGYGR